MDTNPKMTNSERPAFASPEPRYQYPKGEGYAHWDTQKILMVPLFFRILFRVYSRV